MVWKSFLLISVWMEYFCGGGFFNPPEVEGVGVEVGVDVDIQSIIFKGDKNNF